MIDIWIQIGAVALAVGIPAIYWLRYRRKSNIARAALESAEVFAELGVRW